MRRRFYLALIVLAVLLALGGLVVRSAAAGLRTAAGSLEIPSAARANLSSDPLNSMGCILARFAKGSEEKGEGYMPDDELMGLCRPWRA